HRRIHPAALELGLQDLAAWTKVEADIFERQQVLMHPVTLAEFPGTHHQVAVRAQVHERDEVVVLEACLVDHAHLATFDVLATNGPRRLLQVTLVTMRRIANDLPADLAWQHGQVVEETGVSEV